MDGGAETAYARQYAVPLRRIGRENGVPTPVNDWLYEQIRAIEERNRRRV